MGGKECAIEPDLCRTDCGTSKAVALLRFSFWPVSLFVLLYGLGVDHLRGSEDRWAEIPREMLLTGDWFHPAINGEIYFDKPLLSYWPIAIFAKLFNRLDEFTVRLPSTLSALAALWCTRRLGAILFSKNVGDFAGWVALSSLGFVTIARMASADMMNLAAIAMAVCWFFSCKDRAGFWHYLLFYVICFCGALTKGLAPLIIPPLLVLTYVLMDGSWKRHLNVQHGAAILLAAGLFPATFLVAAHTPVPPGFYLPGERLSGLALVWRENILRVFQPFDHKDEGFYSYLYHLPRILAPWSILLFAAPVAVAAQWKTLPLATRWLLVANGIILLMFSMSGSRRWYYIMPIVPFVALLIGEYLVGQASYRWRKPLYVAHVWLLFLLGVFGAAASLMFLLAKHIGWSGLPKDCAALPAAIPYALLAASLLALLVLGAGRRATAASARLACGWLHIAVACAILLGIGLAVIFPEIGALRTEKGFAVALRQRLEGVADRDIAFYRPVNRAVIFYARLAPPVRVVSSMGELREFLADGSAPKYLIAERYQALAPELERSFPAIDFSAPLILEAKRIFEKPGNEKMACWKIPLQE